MPEAEKKPRAPREPWIIRTYAGFGDARQANERFLANLKQGQRGLSIAFDLPTQNGYDPDAPVARGEVGEAGVSICHWHDMERLFEGIPLAVDQHLDDDQRDRAVHPGALPGRRRKARRAVDRAARHHAERSAQRIRRARHFDFSSRAVVSSLHRADPIRRRARAELESDQLLRLPLHGERRRAGRGNRLRLRQRAADPRRDPPEARRRRLRADRPPHFIFHQQRHRAGARDLQDSRVLQTVARAMRDRVRRQGRRLPRRMPGALAHADRAAARSEYHPHRVRGAAGRHLGRRARQRAAVAGLSRGARAARPVRADAAACARSRS